MDTEAPYDLPQLPTATSFQFSSSFQGYDTFPSQPNSQGTNEQSSTPPTTQPTTALEKIEEIFQSLTESVKDGRPLKIPFKSRPRSRDNRATEYDILDRGRGLQYPGPSVKEAWKFSEYYLGILV